MSRAERIRDDAGRHTGIAETSVKGGLDRLLDAVEIAQRLAVNERWVRDATREGRLPHVRLGRYRRYRWSEVEAWIETHSVPGRVTK